MCVVGMTVSSCPVENQPSFHSLKQLFKVSFWVALYYDVILMSSYMQVLGQKDFLELANHILKGDQLIVRGCDVTTVTSIISVLKVSICIHSYS